MSVSTRPSGKGSHAAAHATVISLVRETLYNIQALVWALETIADIRVTLTVADDPVLVTKQGATLVHRNMHVEGVVVLSRRDPWRPWRRLERELEFEADCELRREPQTRLWTVKAAGELYLIGFLSRPAIPFSTEDYSEDSHDAQPIQSDG